MQTPSINLTSQFVENPGIISTSKCGKPHTATHGTINSNKLQILSSEQIARKTPGFDKQLSTEVTKIVF